MRMPKKTITPTAIEIQQILQI